MKTDLTRILSVSGQHGLFNYVAQARNGAIVEALSDKKRTCFDMKSRITTLADISIYTNDFVPPNTRNHQRSAPRIDAARNSA